MGITVISALPGSNLPGPAVPGATAGDDAGGGFAALLSGELLGQMSLTAELGGIVAEAADDKTSGEDEADASLFASLFGQLAGTELTPKSIVTTAAGHSDGNGDSLPIGAGSTRNMPELSSGKPGTQETDGVFEKLLGNNGAAALRGQAANIAGETATGEAPTAVTSQFAAAGTSGTTTGQAAGTAQPSVGTPLHSPAWPQHFGDKIVWLARNDQQTAQLNINPPQLGPVQITLNLNGDQASIAFASPHAEVRQAIESAMPHLKDMLSSAGINLGQANVGANPQQQPRSDTAFGDANGTRSADETAILPANEKGASTAGTTVLQRGRGLVDLFA